MPKKEKKRLQVVISDEQDALLTRLAYELSSPEQLVSKSEVVRLAIEKLADGLGEGQEKARLKELLRKLEAEE
ncbi:MAG: transcriptional regulator [Meiothermus sp.]|uniref:transcriptional regulator n=1 Tax=Meiothermus sp. TaxID=1955249 RepID=UPI0025F5D575|nr:transcriptional regulator [Meiothermus sp.]MCS7059032.1 transcriptional regulator [Meiothermus sp.]MCS7194165.1 transcriptional regulator [Meiothermus sp.]MCX7740629.1 transcriptional regulator [Meiothermus sp.]MDW8090026.1 transcriptional regulator [Meiothermus sp.]MDW8480675.1 transcriptional regulator [Meiothermus sp.]